MRTTPDTLPPLPEPLVRIDQDDDGTWGQLQEHAYDSDYSLRLGDPLFTAGQMRAYALAEREACAKLVEEAYEYESFGLIAAAIRAT